MSSPNPSQRRSVLIRGSLMLLMVLAGMAIPGQGRVNAELAEHTGDPYLAALISFSTGLLVIAALAVATGPGRRSLRRVRPAFHRGEVRWWYLLAGCVGAYFVLTQTMTIGLIGVAIFTVSVVTGQTVGGLVWDRVGLGPAGRKRISPMRVLGAALTVVAVVWAVSPQATVVDRGLLGLLLLVLLPFSGGLFNAGQQALNGRQSAAYRSAIPATLFNFVSGTLVLVLVWLVKLGVDGPGAGSLPTQWWYYIGGPLGCVFIGLGAVLVTKVGVLLAAMGMIAGQLLGSLALDLIFPAPGTVVTTATVLGTVMTLLAVVVASVPDFLRRRDQRGR
ncbi:DMT family transporter [Nesterenkonia sp.]|uniref:DMT family transporter n=1 Tax=Nesterenkonia sp. TaxID=704201 RepID=UPI00260B0269|nr:DMT family transporter [Nesterenkonia sp.]